MARRPVKFENIQAIDAIHIPCGMEDACLDIDDEFPLHYSRGIVRVTDNGNPFSEWLKTKGFEFNRDGYKGEPKWGWLGVWGT